MITLVKWIGIVIGLYCLNIAILELKYRSLGFFGDYIESKWKKELKGAEAIYSFSPNMGKQLNQLGLQKKYVWDSHINNKKTFIWEALEYNPHPPLRNDLDTSYVLYKKDGRIKEIIIARGESDWSPNTIRARGDESFFGDIWLTYVFYIQERDGSIWNLESGTGRHIKEYYDIDWYEYFGSTSNGFETLFPLPMLILEIILIVIFKIVFKKSQPQPL